MMAGEVGTDARDFACRPRRRCCRAHPYAGAQGGAARAQRLLFAEAWSWESIDDHYKYELTKEDHHRTRSTVGVATFVATDQANACRSRGARDWHHTRGAVLALRWDVACGGRRVSAAVPPHRTLGPSSLCRGRPSRVRQNLVEPFVQPLVAVDRSLDILHRIVSDTSMHDVVSVAQ